MLPGVAFQPGRLTERNSHLKAMSSEKFTPSEPMVRDWLISLITTQMISFHPGGRWRHYRHPAPIRLTALSSSFVNTISTSLTASLTRTASPSGLTKLLLAAAMRSEEHTSELQSLAYLVCRLLLEKKN